MGLGGEGRGGDKVVTLHWCVIIPGNICFCAITLSLFFFFLMLRRWSLERGIQNRTHGFFLVYITTLCEILGLYINESYNVDAGLMGCDALRKSTSVSEKFSESIFRADEGRWRLYVPPKCWYSSRRYKQQTNLDVYVVVISTISRVTMMIIKLKKQILDAYFKSLSWQ